MVSWGIKKFQGGTEHIIKASMVLDKHATAQTQREIGPVSMVFEIPMHNISNLRIQYLRIEERSKTYNPARWVRHIASSHSYVCRMN